MKEEEERRRKKRERREKQGERRERNSYLSFSVPKILASLSAMTKRSPTEDKQEKLPTSNPYGFLEDFFLEIGFFFRALNLTLGFLSN